MARQQSGETTRDDDRKLDKEVADSFPASDPPSHSGITGVGPRRVEEKHRRSEPDAGAKPAPDR